jgi:hypothetical protein
VCVCVCERERERESMCECICVCVFVCVSGYALQQIKCNHIIHETAQPICLDTVTSNTPELKKKSNKLEKKHLFALLH